MKNRYASLVCCSVFSIVAPAQQPILSFDDSPQWSVAWSILGMPIGTNAFACTGQQALCGEVYNVLEDLFWAGPGYYRNDGQKTYVRSSPDCALPERLMYDYSLGVGDSTYVGWSWSGVSMDSALAVVAGIDVIQTSGGSRRRFNMLVEYCPSFDEEPLLYPMQWIEGIGSTAHPFYSLICTCDICEIGTALLCADSLGVPVYRTVPGVNCAQTISVQELDGDRTALQVLHALGGFEVIIPDEARGGTLTVMDAAGRLLHERRVTEGERSAFVLVDAAGLLLFRVQARDGKQWNSKLASLTR